MKLVSDLAWGSMLHLTELVSPGWSPDVMCGMSQSVCVALRGRKHRVRTQLPPTDRMVMLLHCSTSAITLEMIISDSNFPYFDGSIVPVSQLFALRYWDSELES